MPRTVLTILLYLFAGYALILILFIVFQNRFIYLPGRTLDDTPARLGMNFEAVTLSTDDGETLFGWWIPAENERGVLLFCHGNAGTIADRLFSIRQFHHLGLSVFIFDYRGYGRSTGKPSENGLYRDVEAAWAYVSTSRNIPASRIVIFGRSLGAAVASWIASSSHPGAVIIESAFTSVPDIAAELYPFLPARLLARSDFNNLERFAKLSTPKLIIHSVDDEIIPISHGRRLFKAAMEPKAFLQISGGHNDGFYLSEPQYTAGIKTFLLTYLKE